MNCPRCRKSMKYMPQYARKAKAKGSHYYCSKCNKIFVIQEKPPIVVF